MTTTEMFGTMDPRTALLDAELADHHHHAEKSYGGVTGDMKAPRCSKGLQARKKLNICGLLQTLLVPPALFVGCFYVMSFRLFYINPAASICLVGLALLFVFLLGGCAFQAQRKERMGGERTWFLILFWSSLLACIVGALLGFINYEANAHSYYDYIGLRKVTDVDPGQWTGQQLMDAGELDFVGGAGPDTNLVSTWHKGTIYCAAPITNLGNGQTYEWAHDGNHAVKLGSYDFWAVGKDCCSPFHQDFGCGWSGQGLRVLDPSDNAAYKLAVEQAVAKYGIQARQPIFLDTGGNRNESPFMAIKQHMLNAESFMTWCCIGFIVLHCGLVGWITYQTSEKARKEGWVGSGV